MFKHTVSVLITVSALLGCQTAMTANSSDNNPAPIASNQAMQESVTWFDGKRERKLWVSEKEFVEFGVSRATEAREIADHVRASVPAATVAKELGGVRIWRTDEAKTAVRDLRANRRSANVSPIFHHSKRGGPRMALPGNFMIRFKDGWSEEQIQAWAEERNLELLKPVLTRSNIYLFKSDPGMAALEVANEIHRSGEVEYATPEWWREVFLK